MTREGSLLKPRFPAPLGMRANTRFRVMSCVFGALAQANGGRVPAGSPVYVLYYFRAWDEARQRPILCIEGLGVGLGARPFADGVDVIYYIAQENYPVEYVERDFPLRVERYARPARLRRPRLPSRRHRRGPRRARAVRARRAGDADGEHAGRALRRGRRARGPHRARASSIPAPPDERELPPPGRRHRGRARRRPALRDVRRRRLGRSRSRAMPSACARTWPAASSRARGALEDYGVVVDAARRWRSTRRRPTRSAAAAPRDLALIDRGPGFAEAEARWRAAQREERACKRLRRP